MSLGKAIKNNIVSPYNKYNIDQEKIAEILTADKEKNAYTISFITKDGISDVVYNVPVKPTIDGSVPWAPKEGDLVEIKEQHQRILIIGKALTPDELNDTTTLDADIYSNTLNGALGGYLGF